MGTRRAFSMVELVIVVAIVAAIVAIAMPRVADFSDRAKAGAGAAHILRLAGAYEAYHAEFGAWPTDTTTLECPDPLLGRLSPRDFSEPPVGSRVYSLVWLNLPDDDWRRGRWVGLITDDAELVAGIDAVLDDGDVTTGRFRGDIPVGAGMYASLRIAGD